MQRGGAGLETVVVSRNVVSMPERIPVKILDDSQIAALKRYNTPTISNAIELFDVRPRHEGFLPPTIKCLFPDMEPMVGYAVTCQIRARDARRQDLRDLRGDYLKWVQSQPGPKVAVTQDLDDPPGVGAFFGDVNGNIHKTLGCVGHVTDGGARDLKEVRALGFHFFTAGVCVSHAYVHIVDFGKPVQIAGVTIKPGDLLHGDMHGVCIIPNEVADRVADACAEVERMERPMIELCQSKDFSVDKLLSLRTQAGTKLAEHR